jgi:hypothetical protein
VLLRIINVSTHPKKTTTVKKVTNRQKIKEPAAQMAHLVLPDTQADPSQNQKSHLFANAQQEYLPLKPNK